MKEGKLCPRCSELNNKVKTLSEFYPYNIGGNTHTYWCKECIEWYIKNVSLRAN